MNAAREHALIIETPEGVRFTMPLASPATRFLALTVDIGIIYSIFIGLGTVTVLVGAISSELAGVLVILAYFLISIGYFMICEWLWRGQTVGKRICKIRVVDAHGLRLQTSQIVLRNLLRFVDSLPLFYFLGGTVALFSRKSQRLGDIAAGTVVVRQKPIQQPNLAQLPENKYNSLRAHPHLEAQLRQRVSAELAVLAFQALLRRQTLEPEVRVKLFVELASSFKALMTFPDEITFGVADEQFVRNCVESIYRASAKKAPTSGADRNLVGASP